MLVVQCLLNVLTLVDAKPNTPKTLFKNRDTTKLIIMSVVEIDKNITLNINNLG